MKIVYIRWQDSSQLYGWQDRDDIEAFAANSPTVCESVGWLVSETRQSVTVASSRSPDQYGEALKIPRKNVLKMRVLKCRPSE